MKRRDFSFALPPHLIARFPAERRGESRLMVVERASGRIAIHSFSTVESLIGDDTFLVVNNTRVIPARLFGTVQEKPVELLLVRRLDDQCAEALALPAKRLSVGGVVQFADGLSAEVLAAGHRGRRTLRFNRPWEEVFRQGFAPLPPYLKRQAHEARHWREFDLERYQTVYAAKPGSIAAPTAGLHFSPEMMARLRRRTEVIEITLEVGEATFQKIEVEDLREHRMGREIIRIRPQQAQEIAALRRAGKKLLAVGTTSVRSLESYAALQPGSEEFASELFIYPGFTFRLVDRLLTNFHLPESSLFILVCAFAGTELMHEAYRRAIAEEFRFFSYGDAMLIL